LKRISKEKLKAHEQAIRERMSYLS